MRPRMTPPLAGLATFTAIAAIVALAVGACRGSFTPTTPVTVLSPRAGLVMNRNAPVTLPDSGKPVPAQPKVIEVGKVASIEALPNGQAAFHLAIDSSQLHLIPANVIVQIAPPTAVHLIPPAEPSPQRLRAGQVLNAQLSESSGAGG
jgi:phospholipid/cholesterol/gamma-HCH transport system substrate-binding protein